MKPIYGFFAAAAAMLAGCSDNTIEEIETPSADMIDIEIAAQEAEATRVEYDDRSLIWQSGDEAAVIVASQSNTISTLTAKTGGSSSTILAGEVPRPADIDDYYAVYPASAVVGTSNGGQIATLSIPATQGDTTKPILTAMCQQSGAADLAMTFTPATAILDITISQPVVHVLFEAVSGEGVAGEFSYDISQGGIHDISSLAGTSIEYLGGSGQTRIRMLVPPRMFSLGYKLTLTDAAGRKMVQSYGYHSGLVLNAGKAYPVNIDFVPVSFEVGELQTSYSHYLAGDIAAANDLSKRLTIAGADVVLKGASSTLIEEVGYYVGDDKHALANGGGSKSFAIPDIEVAAQGNYAVCAYALINGQEYRSASQECIVTGLPINGTPKSGEWEHSRLYVNFHDTYVRMGHNAASDQWLSRSFNIPSDINVSTTTYFKVRTYHGLGTYQSSLTVKLSDITLFTQDSPSNNKTEEQNHTISKDGIFTAASPVFQIDNKGGRSDSYADIYTVDITYR